MQGAETSSHTKIWVHELEVLLHKDVLGLIGYLLWEVNLRKDGVWDSPSQLLGYETSYPLYIIKPVVNKIQQKLLFLSSF